MEFGAVIVDPDNHDILYLNQAQRKELGMLPDEPLKGKKCYELMAGQNAPCEDCCLSKLSHTRAYTRIYHNHVMGVQLLLCHMLIPWNGKSCHFCLMINLDYYLQRHAKQEKLLYQEVSVNDIIRSGMYELKPENGIRKMMNRLGNQLGADNVLILEEKGDLLHFSYIWESRTATPLSKHLKPFPRAEVRPFYERFVQKPVFIIDDFEQFCWDNTDYAPACRTSGSSSLRGCASTTTATATWKSSIQIPSTLKRPCRCSRPSAASSPSCCAIAT